MARPYSNHRSDTDHEEIAMPDTPSQTVAEVYTWYSTVLRDLVQDLMDEAGLDTASDTVDDLCGDLWLHAAELACTGRSFTELLDTLDVNAEILVGRLHNRPPVTATGRLDTAADPTDVAEIATDAVDRTDHGPLPRPRSRWVLAHLSTLHSAA
ncbi:hypothetical protein [Kitasatospora cathayae]|uniref:Uncharacterized protein n=1 Tax=Kitasatospora cathayae TaxID=3004092 RepID=A0ABY7QI99_9ACTN|nr:hypothetical protein [Kitasatospora sp. HUAS 3-15]WBP91975.1 hypothetical protein O1G21_39995 [Kitasatospora sp. HUAS 3-15]